MEGNNFTDNTEVATANATDSYVHNYYGWDTQQLLQNQQVCQNGRVILKVLSFLSAAGSAYIVYSMLNGGVAERKKKLNRTFDRLLLCLCGSDFISSVSLFVGSW